MSLTTRTTAASLIARLITLAAIAAAGLALLTAATAHADTKQGGGGGGKGCPVEDENGNVTYVPAGSHYLLFTCGEDGEWHGGWLITGTKAQLPVSGGSGGGIRPVLTTGIATTAMQQALAPTTPKAAPRPKPRPRAQARWWSKHHHRYYHARR
jgi:hypothetical protein